MDIVFIRRTQTRRTDDGKPYFAHRLVHSERVGNAVRQRTLLNLGRHFDIPQAQWPQLCTRIDDLLTGQAPLVADCPRAVEHEAQRIASHLVARGAQAGGAAAGGADIQTLDVDSLRLVRPRSVGVEQVGLWALEQLGLPALLADLGVNGALRAAAAGVIVGRLAQPALAWSGFFRDGRPLGGRLYSRLKSHLLQLAESRGEEGRRHGQRLAGLILAGWGAVDDARDGRRYVSSGELRTVLLRAGDEFRGAMLWHAERWMRGREADGGDRTRWAALVPELLRDVWPRQRSVKTPATSARLFGLAVANATGFRELAGVVEPLLGRAEGERLRLPRLSTAANVIDAHPRELLGLLYAVLPDRAAAWPFDTGAVLERIGGTDETLGNDNRLRELRRRWEAR